MEFLDTGNEAVAERFKKHSRLCIATVEVRKEGALGSFYSRKVALLSEEFTAERWILEDVRMAGYEPRAILSITYPNKENPNDV